MPGYREISNRDDGPEASARKAEWVNSKEPDVRQRPPVILAGRAL